MTQTGQSLESRLLARVRRGGAGCVFVPADFLDLGSRSAVDVALHRLTDAGTIRRLTRGLYDVPKKHPVLGTLWPSADAVARAIARRDGLRLQPTGAYAANLLGLSEQVPAKVVFLTDGRSRVVKVGRMTIQFRRTTPRIMSVAGSPSGLVIQGLRWIGADNVTSARVARLKQALPPRDRRGLLLSLTAAPVWMHPILRELAGEERRGGARTSPKRKKV